MNSSDKKTEDKRAVFEQFIKQYLALFNKAMNKK